MMSGYASILNGKKGGRPIANPKDKIKLPHVNLVILTANQYNNLINKYGKILLTKALYILEDWLYTSPQGHKYIGKNNYAHFRTDGWVINTAKLSIKKGEL